MRRTPGLIGGGVHSVRALGGPDAISPPIDPAPLMLTAANMPDDLDWSQVTVLLPDGRRMLATDPRLFARPRKT